MIDRSGSADITPDQKLLSFADLGLCGNAVVPSVLGFQYFYTPITIPLARQHSDEELVD